MRYARFYALIPALMLWVAPSLSHAAVDVSVSVNIAPPVIPVYDQPPLPEPGYIWTPGYWAWDGMDYYWVPGTWVLPPASDLLWTPGYWGWNDGVYVWNGGYWAPQVGFYGGIDYGYGYTGEGYAGGYWHGGAFFYNRAVANFGSVRVVNVYAAPARRWGGSHVSFNGGRGGVQARPTAAQQVVMRDRHVAPTSLQRDHQEHARAMPEMHAAQNQGRPQVLTTQRPADFAHPGPGLHNHQTPVPAGHPQPVMHNEPGAPLRREGAQSHDHAQPQVREQPQEHAQPRPQGQSARVGSDERFQPREQSSRQTTPHEQQQPRAQIQHEPPHGQTHEPPQQHIAPRPEPQVMHQPEPAPRPEQHEAMRPPQAAPHPQPPQGGGHEGGGREQGHERE